MPGCIAAPAWNGSERTPKPLVKVDAVLTGLSDGMAITPSCSWSSFFQLLNSALKVALPALSNGPPTPSAADAGRADAELLQLGGGDLVANVERLGDERGLLELLLLDPGERAVVGDAAAGGGRGDQRGIDLLAAERGFDQRLALLDHGGRGLRSLAAGWRCRAGG